MEILLVIAFIVGAIFIIRNERKSAQDVDHSKHSL